MIYMYAHALVAARECYAIPFARSEYDGFEDIVIQDTPVSIKIINIFCVKGVFPGTCVSLLCTPPPHILQDTNTYAKLQQIHIHQRATCSVRHTH